MDTTLTLLVALCTWCYAEPLGDALKRRSDLFGVYASDFAAEYEPIGFAAVPLHPPLPVVQVLSAAPASATLDRPPYAASHALAYARPYLYAPSAKHTAYSNPFADLDPDFNKLESAYSKLEPVYSKLDPLYGKLEPAYNKLEPVYAKLEPTYGKLKPSASILYARPNKYGGYSYTRRPSNKRQPQKRPPRKEKPVIIRVHKYRIIKSR